jgi:hypothetical protein
MKNKEGTHRYSGGHESHFGKKKGILVLDTNPNTVSNTE